MRLDYAAISVIVALPTPQKAQPRTTTRKRPMTHNQQQCKLFDLPQELRDLIYRFTLVKSSPISSQRQSHRHEERTTAHPLLLSCRRLREEALQIYFGSNTFRFHDDGELLDEQLPAFFRCLAPDTLKLCTAISLESSLGPQHNRACPCKYCIGSVEIDLQNATATTTGRSNCCIQAASELKQAQEKVQAVLRRLKLSDHMETAKQRARLGTQVAIEFCAIFEYLHPDYGD